MLLSLQEKGSPIWTDILSMYSFTASISVLLLLLLLFNATAPLSLTSKAMVKSLGSGFRRTHLTLAKSFKLLLSHSSLSIYKQDNRVIMRNEITNSKHSKQDLSIVALLGQDNYLGELVQCIIGCLAAFLTGSTPPFPTRLWQPKSCTDINKCTLQGKIIPSWEPLT